MKMLLHTCLLLVSQLILLFGVVQGTLLNSWATSMPERSVAVMGFTASGSDSSEDWAAGLADFSLAILQEQGVETFERNQMNYLLAEYKLQEQGFTETSEIVRNKLPWVHFLLRGNILNKGNQKFTLNISLTDMTTGGEVATVSNSGKYPDQLAKVTTTLIEEISKKIGGKITKKAKKSERVGFTNSPEIALLYYKGLDYYLKGRPGYAEYYFRHAYSLDKNFFIARRWQVRTYEALDLSDFSQLISRELQQLNTHQQATHIEKKEHLVVSVVPPFDGQKRKERLEGVLHSVLADHLALQLFSHEAITAISDEIDRGLHKNFDQHVLKNQEWLSTDVLFSISSTDKGKDKQLTVLMTDSMSGQILGSVTSVVEKEAKESAVQKKVQKAVQQLWESNVRAEGGGSTLRYTLEPINPDRYHKKNQTPVERESLVLRTMSNSPKSLHALNAYLNIAVMGNMINNTFEWPLVELVLNRMEEIIQDDTHNASFWKYHIQWMRVFREWFDPWAKEENGIIAQRKDGKLFEKYFSDLIARHGDSLPGLLAQYAVALDKLYSGDATRSFAILDEIADTIVQTPLLEKIARTPMMREKENRRYAVAAVIYYFAAKTGGAAGEKEKARMYAIKSEQALNQFYQEMGLEPTSLTPKVFPALYGVGLTEQKSWGLVKYLPPPDLIVRDGFREEIDQLKMQLASGKQKELSVDQLRDRLNSQLPPEEIVRLGKQLLQHIIQEVKQGKRLKRYVTMSVNTARRIASKTPPEKREETVVLLQKLTEAYKDHYDEMLRVCPDPEKKCARIDKETGKKEYLPLSSWIFDPLMFDLALVSSHYDFIDQQAKNMLVSRYAVRRMRGARNKAWLLYETESPHAAAEFLFREIQRFEEDFPQNRRRNYVELLSWCAQAYLDAGDTGHALQVYQRGVEQTVEVQNKDVPCQERELAASMMYQAAKLQGQHGEPLEAVELLKDVIPLAENCERGQFSLYRITERDTRRHPLAAPFFSGRNGLLEMSLQAIEQQRSLKGSPSQDKVTN